MTHAGQLFKSVKVGVGTGVVVGGNIDVVIAEENVLDGVATTVLDGVRRNDNVTISDSVTFVVRVTVVALPESVRKRDVERVLLPTELVAEAVPPDRESVRLGEALDKLSDSVTVVEVVKVFSVGVGSTLAVSVWLVVPVVSVRE